MTREMERRQPETFLKVRINILSAMAMDTFKQIALIKGYS